MALIGDHNLAAVQLTVGSFRVTGFGPDDAISLAPMSDLIQSDVSADGAHVPISQINDPRWEGTMFVRRNTAAFRLLMESLQDQLAAAISGAIPPLAFQVFDPISGDKITEANMRYVRYPDQGYAQAAAVAEFAILLPSPAIIGGANVDISA